MLHKYEKIDEAMSACVALEYPLVVLVHGKLPSNLNTAEEATRSGSGRGGAPTYSFLPPSYTAGSSSLFTDDTVPFESTLAAPNEETASTNAALGYLMRPANLSAAATADLAVVAKAVSDGEELTLVRDFPLGSVQSGAAQREALLIALLESRLGSVTLLHLIEQGTPAYDSFSAAVSVSHAPGGVQSSEVLPRVHIFYAPPIGLSPMVLHGTALTPQNLYNCVQMGLLRPRNRTMGEGGAPAATSASTAASTLRSFFTTSVATMNAECERHRQGSSAALRPNSSSSGNASSNATAADDAAAKKPILSTPAVRATGVSRADALAAAHLISVAGLPTSFSTGPVPGTNSSSTSNSGGGTITPGSHKTILTTPSMTMQTVWRAVEKHLDWAQHEAQQAQAAMVWNGVTPPKPGAKFTLTVAESGTGAGEEKAAAAVVVKTLAEAERVRLQDFPRNTVVTVAFEGWPPVDSPAPAASVPPPQQQQPTPALSSPSDYVCEGDVCRRRLPGETAEKSSSAAAVSAPALEERAPGVTASAPPASASPSSPASASASTPSSSPAVVATIKLHCSLPNGKTLDVDQLDPAMDTLQASVRPVVEEALGYENFIFVCAYPPKRYSAEVDEPRLLKDIGLARSSALRVVSLDGPGSPNAANASGQQQHQQRQAGATRQMLSNAASSLLGMLAGRRANSNANPQPTAGSGGSGRDGNASSSASKEPRRAYNSMAEMLAANEAAEQEMAMQRLRQEQEQQQQQRPFMGQDPADAAQQQRAQGKKSNRYFGGGSTEYIAEGDSGANQKDGRGSDDDNNPHSAMEGLTQEQQAAFLRAQLQRVMRQQRSRVGEGEWGADKEVEEEMGDGSQRGGSEQLRAFQGQGRRLAGDGLPSNANSPSGSADAQSSQPSSPPDASAAKKNQ
ncbi:hypothetical protein ABB37_00271 [Leptomonas pyrrhocoris]|uniref:Uncharacterized protein n=1 Tax=Leptomonas pyrrhocoris TaxID=157538 RepID=A0A0M9GAA2_LEPPY|nr:hypothetical protein ABB37_00271 [Leptomonas pyrrhocoris]KPA85979.1 hypothetical protein ABB37_00271 [Leptomonas pyrrhocoris]|eukprot:XP_015664418.1 hypothetical protein ABB37_00271 [Leptomonas pyrrhocoris]